MKSGFFLFSLLAGDDFRFAFGGRGSFFNFFLLHDASDDDGVGGQVTRDAFRHFHVGDGDVLVQRQVADVDEQSVRNIQSGAFNFSFVNELFDRTFEKNYEKFTEMAANFRNLIHFINELEDENKIVYFLHHSETDSTGREKAKTIGKMLEEKLVLEGCFDVVLYCEDHKFFTQSNAQSSAKSPEDMFDLEIPNDLKFVDTKIREYYGLEGGKK